MPLTVKVVEVCSRAVVHQIGVCAEHLVVAVDDETPIVDDVDAVVRLVPAGQAMR
jgi:hypothetical protein